MFLSHPQKPIMVTEYINRHTHSQPTNRDMGRSKAKKGTQTGIICHRSWLCSDCSSMYGIVGVGKYDLLSAQKVNNGC